MRKFSSSKKISLRFKIYPDYYLIVTKPIDLKIIATKITKNEYGTLEDMENDLLLMIANARKYNDPKSQIYKVFFVFSIRRSSFERVSSFQDACALKKIITNVRNEIEAAMKSTNDQLRSETNWKFSFLDLVFFSRFEDCVNVTFHFHPKWRTWNIRKSRMTTKLFKRLTTNRIQKPVPWLMKTILIEFCTTLWKTTNLVLKRWSIHLWNCRIDVSIRIITKKSNGRSPCRW